MKYNQNKLLQINKDSWQEVVSRPNYPLLNSFLRTGVLIRNKDLSFDNSLSYQLLFNPKIYVLKSDIKKLDNRIKRGIRMDNNFVVDYLDYLEQHCELYLKFIKKLSKLSEQRLTKSKLLDLFIQYKNETKKIISHIYPPLSFEKCIIEEIQESIAKNIKFKRGSKELNNLIQQLIKPEDYSMVMRREVSILKLASKLNLKEINKNNRLIINEHKKYYWLSDHAWDMEEESLDNFIKTIKSEKKLNSDQKLRLLRQELLETKKIKKYLADKYNLDNKTMSLCREASRLPVLRGLRLEVILQSRHILNNNFFKQISEAVGADNINKYYYWEIEDILKNRSVNIKIIKKRTLEHSFLASRAEVCVISNKDINKFVNITRSSDNLDKISGSVASPGLASGVVKIITQKSQYKDFNEGEILVTSMTTPDFVPLMKKSAAIITDEGGISCHAAIVSRELKKPCIVGTKIATQILKNGDIVEVDANKGIARIIKRV